MKANTNIKKYLIWFLIATIINCASVILYKILNSDSHESTWLIGNVAGGFIASIYYQIITRHEK